MTSYNVVALALSIIVPIVTGMVPVFVAIKNWRNDQHREAVKLERRISRLETKLETVSSSLRRLEARQYG